ncbi:MAG: hypothetical protein WD066_09805 [Planctomycetaceae bacterium]
MRTMLTRVSTTTAVLLLGSALALACSVPVFRYALERWQADPYVLLVFHEGPLSPEQQALIEKFRAFEQPAPGEPGRITPVNLHVEAFDVKDDLHEEVAGIWKRHEAQARVDDGALPWMVLRFPWESGLPADVWSGPFTEANLDRLLVSPKRNELATRILGGDSAVWLVIGSGDAERDAKVAKDLKAELETVEKLAILPEISPEDQEMLAPGGPKLEVKFSVLPVNRDDPRDEFFVHSLLTAARANIENQIAGIDLQLADRRKRLEEMEKDPEVDPEALAQRKEGLVNITRRYDEMKEHLRQGIADLDGPVVVPVTGRGRAIDFLAGEGLVPAAYSGWCSFLLGPCSCEIKGQNPGYDLLISADWIGRISGEFTVKQALPPLTGPFATIAAVPADHSFPTESDGAADESEGAVASGVATTGVGGDSAPAPGVANASAENEGSATSAAGETVSASAPESSSPAAVSVEGESLLLRNVALALVGGIVIVLGAGVALQWKRREG